MQSQDNTQKMSFGPLGVRIDPAVLAKGNTQQSVITGEADCTNKEWQHEVTPNLRNLLVRKLVQAMTTTPEQKELASENAQALKIEGDIFDKATSRREYYNEIADAVYKMQKEFDEKRKLEEMQLLQSDAEQQHQQQQAQS